MLGAPAGAVGRTIGPGVESWKVRPITGAAAGAPCAMDMFVSTKAPNATVMQSLFILVPFLILSTMFGCLTLHYI
jgi:hypothetical protein